MMEFEGQGKTWPTVEEALAKDTWGEDDIAVLVHHKDFLPHDALVKLGLAPVVETEAVTDAAPVVEKKKKK